MTPLAARFANELLLPRVKRTADDRAGVIDLIDQDLHCFEVSAVLRSVQDVLEQPLRDKDSEKAWGIYEEVATMVPRLFLPSPTTWLEYKHDGRTAYVLTDRGEGLFKLMMARDNGDLWSMPLCEFRARNLFEPGERLDVISLLPDREKDLFDVGKLPIPKPEDKVPLEVVESRRNLALLSVIRTEREISIMTEVSQMLRTGIMISVLLLNLINTPGLLGLKQRDIHKALARKLYAARVGKYPLRGWSEVVLKHETKVYDGEERLSGTSYHKCLHFVRSHLRHYRDGSTTLIPAHWRGDPALGIKRTRYKVAA